MLLSPGDDAINDASRQALIQGACQKGNSLFLLKILNFKGNQARLQITF
jgi:hypothetical protein